MVDSLHLVGWEDQFRAFVLGNTKKSIFSDLVLRTRSQCSNVVQEDVDRRPLSRSLTVHALELLDQSCEKVFESLAMNPQGTLEACDRILEDLAKTILTKVQKKNLLFFQNEFLF